jgi:hypothetical protein
MHRSCLVQTLNGDPAASPLGGAHRRDAPYSSHRAPQRVRLGPSLAAALLDSLFEHPARGSSVVLLIQTVEFPRVILMFSPQRARGSQPFPHNRL